MAKKKSGASEQTPVHLRHQPGGELPQVEIFGGRDCLEVLDELAARCRKTGEYFHTAFADPPFNWNVGYDVCDDKVSPEDYRAFTRNWVLKLCEVVAADGTVWINCPEDVLLPVGLAAEAAGLKLRRQNVWHYRFGQCINSNFISSHTNAMYYVRDPKNYSWFPDLILEPSDRAAIYNDPRTQAKKDASMKGLRVPLDVWYGPGLARVQGNNKERCPGHENQLPEAYVRRALLSTTPPRGRVITPFSGSGTEVAVAVKLGFDAVGIDLSSAYAEAAMDRAKRAYANKECNE